MPIRNRNPLRGKTNAQLIKGVDDTVRDQMGFVTGIVDGQYTAQLKDGSVIRGILPENTLTNASLSIGTPVYVVPREGVPLLDSEKVEVLPQTEVATIQDIGASP